jgi:hypothetical protein
MIPKSLISSLGVDQKKKKAGMLPKVSEFQLCTLSILNGKKKRNLYSEHYREEVRFEVMVVCDSEGMVYDL